MRPLTQYFPLCVRGSGNYALVDKDQKRLCESIHCAARNSLLHVQSALSLQRLNEKLLCEMFALEVI